MKITKKSRHLCLFMIFGDGTINSNGYLAIRHKQDQMEYLQWKNNLLNKHGINTTGLYYVSNNNYGSYEMRTYSHKFLKLYRRIIYKPFKQIANKRLLDKLTPLGLAIWYMDDGSISTQYKNGKPSRSILTICTCISKEDNQIIIDYISEKWGVKFGMRKMKNSYALVCSTKEARKFLDIVRPFVNEVECMKYKLNIKNN